MKQITEYFVFHFKQAQIITRITYRSLMNSTKLESDHNKIIKTGS